MFNIDTMLQAVTAAVGALGFTMITVSAAVGPARAVETAPQAVVAAAVDQDAVA
jgi:hypothetical protein